jgi:NAD(P)-dependent dehydrogenase (short-subunit alcohol dehydrogenase family)
MVGALAGRRILITGASGGMGSAIAARFADEGAALALLDHRAEAVTELARSLACSGFGCDVSRSDEVEAAVTWAVTELGGLDGVVNAAGVYIPETFQSLTCASWARTIAVNLDGPFHVIRCALAALQRAPSATIVNIASINSFVPLRATASYCASKGGLLMLTKCLALELGPAIRANAVCPGVIATDMTRHITSDPDYARRAAGRTALNRLGQPADIAEAALYLTSAASGFVTGTEIVIDGGFTWR